VGKKEVDPPLQSFRITQSFIRSYLTLENVHIRSPRASNSSFEAFRDFEIFIRNLRSYQKKQVELFEAPKSPCLKLSEISKSFSEAFRNCKTFRSFAKFQNL
jgi:hypothetical protein